LGFAEFTTYYQNENVHFSFGEQDLFITSEISDKVSFLGETVFKFNPGSETQFAISVERLIVKYNIKGNHYILGGKHHTPLNYWNDSYHHGRVFFPTTQRPLLFADEIIPIHTTGLSLQGYNLGKANFGYDVMVGNGLGSGEIFDNDQFKSVTLSAHVKPVDGMKIMASGYFDRVSKGADIHTMDTTATHDINQQVFTGSLAYFRKRLELLAEGSFATNATDSLDARQAIALYAYAGLRIKSKMIPYVRLDYLTYEKGDPYFPDNDKIALVGGLRYEFNFLAVVKLEFMHRDSELADASNRVSLQFAVGF